MTTTHTTSILSLALLAACGLQPYASSGTAADATTTATTTTGASSTAATAIASNSTTTLAPTTTNPPVEYGPGVWRGLYQQDYFAEFAYQRVFIDCATQHTWQIRGDAVPYQCSEVNAGDGLYLHIAGVLHPDGDDPDPFDEIELTEFLSSPCKNGTCEHPSDWSPCGPWEDVCGYYVGCDPWIQDCPEGQKCAPYSAYGDNSWDSLKCVPVAPGAGGLGDPCTSENFGLDGVDTCAEGHMCWGVDADTKIGTCIAQCTGSPDAPIGETCSRCLDGGVLTLCFPACSPLLQDCTSGDVCIPYSNDFVCALDVSGDEGQLFDVCEYFNACDPGLWCAPPDHASECDPQALGCCLPFCDVNQPTCPGAGQQCIPWSDPPPACGNENLGTCRLPP